MVDLFELKALRGTSAEIVVRDPSKAGIARGYVAFVAQLLSKVAGANISVSLLEGGAETHATADAAARTPRMPDPGTPAVVGSVGARMLELDAAARSQALEQPLVKKAMDLFNARLIGVEAADGSGR